MRTFCGILLLGVVTYVHANDCTKYAVKVGKRGEASSLSGQQVIALDQFLAKKISSFKTAMASPFGKSPDACTAFTHGEKCNGVEYSRKFLENYENAEKLSDVEFYTTFVGYNKVDNIAIGYEMTIGGNHDEYYIFKHSEKNSNIKVFKFTTPEAATSEVTPTDIDSSVSEVITSEFALFKYRPGKYYIYTTCDLQHAWVNFEYNAQFQSEDTELTADIQALKDFAKEKEISLELNPIDTTFTESLSHYVTTIYPENR